MSTMCIHVHVCIRNSSHTCICSMLQSSYYFYNNNVDICFRVSLILTLIVILVVKTPR